MIPSWSFSPLNIACLVLSVGCKSNLFTNILNFFFTISIYQNAVTQPRTIYHL